MTDTKLLLSKQLVKFRDKKELLEEETKIVNSKIKEISIKLVNIMDANGELSFKTKDGLFYQFTDLYTQIIDKEKVFDWLKNRKVFGKLARLDINTNTLKAWIKERIKDKKPYPTEGINCYYETTVRVKKGDRNGNKEKSD